MKLGEFVGVFHESAHVNVDIYDDLQFIGSVPVQSKLLKPYHHRIIAWVRHASTEDVRLAVILEAESEEVIYDSRTTETSGGES